MKKQNDNPGISHLPPDEEALRRRLDASILKEELFLEVMDAQALETPEPEETPSRKKLKRELEEEALARLEDAARTEAEFQNVISWWDKRDANRERKERYHEISRSGDDVPLDYGATRDDLYFPGRLNGVLMKEVRKGEFLDVIFQCPFEIHELVSDRELCRILNDLKAEQKELLFQSAVQYMDSECIAMLRGQTDRNIRKIRVTMMKKVRKKLLAALSEKVGKQLPLTLLERGFYEDGGKVIECRKRACG